MQVHRLGTIGGASMTPSIQVWADKCHDRPEPNWLLTLAIGLEHAGMVSGNYMSAYPQAWAVVDNFGNLVRVESFGL